ncbi:valyl-tRNA synthetase [Halovenus aranensis]|uniref:Valine--tRNA ligase n=1 Tax=Halovenus aranensis TaxID=890420 RepID=A0A1G8U585_9EURY|nr:valine--tRNA ligase [Halovenus aranensis]SDJ48928.1 valyl-tRNA synthetase [Halovenus aranensis]
MSETDHSSNEESPANNDRDGLSGEYDPEAVEPTWQQRWVDEETYAYQGDLDTQYSIDTPPPTVSGDLHMGHLYGLTLMDFVARFKRMYGDDVYFPFGYDDNGIASERLTERELGINHGDFTRREFQEKCRDVCQDYEAEFTDDVQSLAISIDWENTYKTISPQVQRTSQLSFLDLYDQGREYRQRAPTIWCPDCETAISQVEQEDLTKQTKFNDIDFELVEAGDGETTQETFTISTTRPELLPACVSVFVHPDDDANQHLVGGTARVPLFGQEVPILEDDRVDLETGSGLVMCCTFGDQTDIEWYQAHDLDLRIAIDESGTMTDLADEYEGLSTADARAAIIEDLDEAGYLLESRDHEHTVQVHERCDEEVEYLVTEQWYVEILDKKDEYLDAGREIDWHPEKMFTRYKHWIEGLEWDWCISRQRDSGIPFPVWYCQECDEAITADREALPVDPIEDEPPVDACPDCGHDEFAPDKDVFDTWATSSLTPLVNAGWDWDADVGELRMEQPELYPMNLRPQGHDIISFWLFHTVVKCYEHTGEAPFEDVIIHGMVLDENREAMSKSKGNFIAPSEVIDEYPIDATRYWTASASIGDDFPYRENALEAGERLLQKLWNASRLVDQLTEDVDRSILDEERPESELADIDRWFLARLDETIESLTERFDNYEFAKARDDLRTFFWSTFCDDYLEIAKQRLSGGGDESTEYTLLRAHNTFLKLWAPLLPHVTEELYQRLYDPEESLHRQAWPEPAGYDADLAAGETAMEVIGALRRYKTEEGLPLNERLEAVDIYGHVGGFSDAISDVMHVTRIETFDDEPEVTTEISDIDLDYSLVGPEFGSDVGAIDDAIESGEFEVSGDTLYLADGQFELDDEMFEIEKSRTYSGEGQMIETERAVVIVR